MSDLERELRDALAARAGDEPAHLDPPDDLASRVRARRNLRRALTGGGALALAALLVVSAAALTRDVDEDSSIVVGGAGAPDEIVAVTTDGDLVVLDAETGSVLRTLVDGSSGSVAPATPAVTPDGRHAYVTFGTGCDARISKVDLVSGVGPGADLAVIANGYAPSLNPGGTQLAYLACTRPRGPGSAFAVTPVDGFASRSWPVDMEHPDSRAIAPLVWATSGDVFVTVDPGTGRRFVHRVEQQSLATVPESQTIEFPDFVRLLGSLDETGALLGGADSADVLAIDPDTGQVARVLFHLTENLPSKASSDASGRHVLVVDESGTLSAWSEGDDAPHVVASGIASAAWIPDRSVEPPPTTASSTSTSTVPAPQCSAFPMKIAVEPDASLPAPVREKWSAVLEAAIACDWDALRALMVDDFAYSVAAWYSADDAIGEWQDAEARGEPILRTLVERLLDEPRVVGPDGTIYEWPDPTSDLLYRAGIRADGAWIYFVAGD